MRLHLTLAVAGTVVEFILALGMDAPRTTPVWQRPEPV